MIDNKEFIDYIDNLNKDRKKLLNLKNFIRSELAFEKQPKMGKKGFKTEKIEFLEKVLKIIEE